MPEKKRIWASATIALSLVALACNEQALHRESPPRVPRSTATTKAPRGAIRFTLREDALYVEGSEVAVVHRALDHASGFDPWEENHYQLPALGMVVDAKRETGAKVALLELDPDATYRELIGLVATIHDHGMETCLAVEGEGGRRAICLVPYRSPPNDSQPVDLRLVAVDGSFALTARRSIEHEVPVHLTADPKPQVWRWREYEQQPIGRGCRDFGEGPAVARPTAGWDFAALATCARALSRWVAVDHTDPRFTYDLKEIFLGTAAATPYRDVIAMMDAVRADGEGEIFPIVYFTAPP